MPPDETKRLLREENAPSDLNSNTITTSTSVEERNEDERLEPSSRDGSVEDACAAKKGRNKRKAEPDPKDEDGGSSSFVEGSPAAPPPRRSSRRRRCSARNREASLAELACHICSGANVVFITGAGLSVASGIRPFRSCSGVSGHGLSETKLARQVTDTGILKNGPVRLSGLWNNVIWTTATRRALLKDPVAWYNDFWIPHFLKQDQKGGSAATQHYRPNRGHMALRELHAMFPSTLRQITQNIDGLQPGETPNLIEAHGRVGLYKCLPNDLDGDSTDSEEDDVDEDRSVHLGHRRRAAQLRARAERSEQCPYRFLRSLEAGQLEPSSARRVLDPCRRQRWQEGENDCSSDEDGDFNKSKRGDKDESHREHEEQKKKSGGSLLSLRLRKAPTCPLCGGWVQPQALLFDEGYHSHSFYRFETAEEWIATAHVLVFCGTSFSVRLTQQALQHARTAGLPVYNFNLPADNLQATPRLLATNITGPASETLPRLAAACRELQREREHEKRRQSSSIFSSGNSGGGDGIMPASTTIED